MPAETTRRRSVPLTVVSAFVAVSATVGAVGLMGGDILGPAVTARLPFASSLLAGITLAVVVAVPMAVCALLAAVGSRHTATAAVAAGVLLIGWVLVQPVIIRYFSWLQPFYGLLGVVVAWLGLRLRGRRP
ncbi:hypothetical protein NI17_006670 [Thermobifida halotolerans]|uniref:Uncharacterized protein n=1 Tax=Thermobifida halotolerans TaxID=483545 RepID=A0AA97M567_9ACTN|nr:hypothetical protein [Thermobifida halotolerans]UOE20858.1 hypothetical protein NI17_006670 [Thermobifida halotolerans]